MDGRTEAPAIEPEPRRPRALEKRAAVAHARRWLLACLLTASAVCPDPLRAQSSKAQLDRAIAAYQAGDFTGALAALDSLPPALPSSQKSQALVYRGLVQFALEGAAAARRWFADAVVRDPTLRLDPSLHAPSRVSEFEAVRDSVVNVWRTEAMAAESRGDVREALNRYRQVLAATPEDSALLARATLLQRKANPALQGVATAAPEPPPVQAETTTTRPVTVAVPYSAGQALTLGVFFPGVGEMYIGRPVRGLLILGAAAGSVAFGVLTERVSVKCLTPPVNNTCPPEDVASDRKERPYLVPGVAVAAALTLFGAFDAYRAAHRANQRALDAARGDTNGTGSGIHLEPPALDASTDGVRLTLLRLRF